VVYDISVDLPTWHYEIIDENGDVFLTEEEGILIPGDQISWKIGDPGIYYISIYTEGNACGEEVGSTFEISVNDEIPVPNINADEIGICHHESTADITLDGRPGETVFYHLYDAENIDSSLDSVYAGVDEIIFPNLIQGKYFVRAQDIKSECFSAYTDTIFVQPYLTEADTSVYNTMFWENLIPDFNTIEYMSDGELSLNIDMDELESVNSGKFDSYSVVQFNNPFIGFEVDNDGSFTITEGSDDYIVAGKYADECSLYPITKNWLQVREDSLVAPDILIYLNEDEYIDSANVNLSYTEIDEGKLKFKFFIDPEFDFRISEDGYFVEFFTGDYTLIPKGESATIIFEKGLSFFGANSDVSYIVWNEDYSSRKDTGRIYVYAGNKELNEDKSIFIPNAFSPNGDGENDHFVIETDDFSSTESSTLEVFNRWGTMVYRSEGDKYGKNDEWWDGSANISNMVTIGDELPGGVYFYVYTVEILVEEENKPIVRKYHGFVELRR
jgi:gliding motility-associated-like protein